jgi:hypothetical protein
VSQEAWSEPEQERDHHGRLLPVPLPPSGPVPIPSKEERERMRDYFTDVARWPGPNGQPSRDGLALLAALEAVEELPQWIITKLKTLGEYYEPPTDGRDMAHEIYGWMHVLCFHYIQNRREVKEYDAARRAIKAMQKERDEEKDRRQETIAMCQQLAGERDTIRDALADDKMERRKTLANIRAERDALQAKLDSQPWVREVQELCRQRDALAEALRPFDAAMEVCEPTLSDDWRVYVSLGECRRAKKALDSLDVKDRINEPE